MSGILIVGLVVVGLIILFILKKNKKYKTSETTITTTIVETSTTTTTTTKLNENTLDVNLSCCYKQMSGGVVEVYIYSDFPVDVDLIIDVKVEDDLLGCCFDSKVNMFIGDTISHSDDINLTNGGSKAVGCQIVSINVLSPTLKNYIAKADYGFGCM